MTKDVTHLYEEFGGDRLPPGQRETQRFPVLSKSGTPSWDPETWSFDVWGAVDNPLDLSFDEFRDLPSETQKQDFHCVTGWSKFDCEFEGVTFPTLAEEAGVTDDAVHVMFHAL
ncbi:molybdopterin-dependent oxidoreductase, partial [Haloferax profundi]|uniref:molybdopterin-dependent oxidoreductase n=1 Tax=Haloferax profundi TaxID=1544718 RepID=UPI000AC81F86